MKSWVVFSRILHLNSYYTATSIECLQSLGCPCEGFSNVLTPIKHMYKILILFIYLKIHIDWKKQSPLILYTLRVSYRFYLNARWFYSSKGNPLGLQGLKNYLAQVANPYSVATSHFCKDSGLIIMNFFWKSCWLCSHDNLTGSIKLFFSLRGFVAMC